jgi:hypothetical protein
LNFDENGFILSHDQLMRNHVAEINKDDIKSLITNFVTEEQRWSQSVREEVKYIDMNPDSGRDYILDEFRTKNTAGTVVTMPYGDMITFNSSRHFFRGENRIYPSSIPSLNRKLMHLTSKKDKELYRAVSDLRMYQFFKAIWNIHIVPYWEAKLCDVNYKALAQHYGFETSLLDLTNDFTTALFFATCYYDKKENKFFPLTKDMIERSEETRYGMLFHSPNWRLYWFNGGGFMSWASNHNLEELKEPCTIDSGILDGCALQIGYQPLLRCHSQNAYVLPMRENAPLQMDSRFEKWRFKQSEELSNYVYEMMDCGRKIYPEEGITSILDIIEKIQKSNIFSEDDIQFVYEMDVAKALFSTVDKFKMDLLETEVSVDGIKKRIELVRDDILYITDMSRLESINRIYNNIDIGAQIGGMIHQKGPQKRWREERCKQIYGKLI